VHNNDAVAAHETTQRENFKDFFYHKMLFAIVTD
jgi:hypothetical protein